MNLLDGFDGALAQSEEQMVRAAQHASSDGQSSAFHAELVVEPLR
jgi:hypothetical protein